MSKDQVMNAILELPITEQVEIRQALIARLELSDEGYVEIERRHTAFIANPTSGWTLEQLETERQQRRLAQKS